MANINVIPKSPVISEAELTEALIKEFVSGRKFMEAREEVRARETAREVQQDKGHRSVKGLGKKVTEMPAEDWFRLQQAYGAEAMYDKGFHRDLHRLEEVYKVNNL